MLEPLSLIAVSILSGIALLWVFAKTSDQPAVRATKKRLQARLLEMRLYADDPGVVLESQKQLLWLNLRYFLLMLRPAAVATVPMVLLLIVLDGFYGKQPLVVDQQAIVTAQFTTAADAELEAPPGIDVETQPVRAIGERQVSWRIRPRELVRGDLRVSTGGVTDTKSVKSGDGITYLSSRRVRSLVSMLLYPGEPPLSEDAIEWIAVEYPPAEVSLLGLRTHWLVWFLIFSMGAAFLLKGKFGVTV